MKAQSCTLFFLTLLLTIVSPYVSGQMQMPGQMPAMPQGMGMPGPGFGGPQFGPGGPGQMPSGPGFPAPSEEDFARAMQEIENMSPAQIAEAERMGQMIIANMSDAEFAQVAPMFEMMGLAPAEVREEARRAVAGGFEPAPEPTPAPPREEVAPAPVQPKVAPQPAPSKTAVLRAKDLVKTLISSLATLQQKASGVREVHEKVRAWLQELRDIMFYLRVMDRHEYYEHLSLPQFKRLLNALTLLHEELKAALPDVALPDDLLEESSPYDVLGIDTEASQAVIESVYQKLSEKHDPIKLEAKLKKEDLSEKDIQRQLKIAKLATEALEEAYDLISDPKSRAQVDREIKAHEEIRRQKIERATKSLKNISEALGFAIYNNDLLGELEKFLLSYGPKQLALKKEMEDAEKKRLEEQKNLAKIVPSKTSGPFEPTISYTPPSYDYGYSSDFPYNNYHNYSNYPDFSYGQPSYGPEQSQAAEKAAGKAAEEKEKKQQEEGKVPAPKDKKIPETDKRTVDQIITDLSNNFTSLVKQYKEPATKKIIDDFGSYLRKTRPKAAAEEDEEEEEITLAGEQREEKEKIVEEEPTPVETVRTTTLKQLRSTLKLNTLASDAAALLDKMRQLGKAPTAGQKSSFFKLLSKVEKDAPVVKELQEKLSALVANAPEAKKAAHGAAVNEMLSDINTFAAAFGKVSDQYFDVGPGGEEKEEKSPAGKTEKATAEA